MHILRLDLIFGLLALSFAELINAENLLVEVNGVTLKQGQVICTLFNQEVQFLKTPYRTDIVEVLEKLETHSCEFNDIEAGIYAISVIHDQNANNELDTNFLGIPKEAVGSSNNAKSRFGPPSFENAKFELSGEDKTLKMVIELDYVM